VFRLATGRARPARCGWSFMAGLPSGFALLPLSPFLVLLRGLRAWWAHHFVTSVSLVGGHLRAYVGGTVRAERAKPVQPGVDVREWRRIDRVQPLRTAGPNRREPTISEDSQMQRNRGLRDPELGPNHRTDLARRRLATGENFKDPPANRVAQHIEGVCHQKR